MVCVLSGAPALPPRRILAIATPLLRLHHAHRAPPAGLLFALIFLLRLLHIAAARALKEALADFRQPFVGFLPRKRSGLVEAFSVMAIPSEWQNMIAFLVMILVLLLRPQGLLGRAVVR